MVHLIKIRKAKPSEINKCAKFCKEVLRNEMYKNLKEYPKIALDFDIHNSSAKKIKEQTKKGKGFIYIALDKKKIIGLIWGHIIGSHPWNTGLSYVRFLAVSSDYKRKGIGAKLIKLAEKWSKQHNCHKLYTDTHIKIGALPFYKKVGMKPFTSLKNFWWGLDWLFVGKDL